MARKVDVDSEAAVNFFRTVVLRYRIHLEQRHYAPATINLRLAAVRRAAYEAADAGLLGQNSPRAFAGERRAALGRAPWATVYRRSCSLGLRG
jgi:hypothetical protein